MNTQALLITKWLLESINSFHKNITIVFGIIVLTG